MNSGIKFSCPNCDQLFTLDEWLKHDKNQEQMNLYIKDLVAEGREKIKNDYLDQAKKAVELAKLNVTQEFTTKISNLNLERQKTEQDLWGKLNLKDAEILKLKETEQNTIALARAEIAKQYDDQINQLKLELQKVKNETTSLLSQKQSEANLLSEKHATFVAQLKNSLTEKHLLEENKLKEEIRGLEIKNAEKRVLQNKIIGENWENEVEGELRKAFGSTNDKIEKINKSIDGTKADYLQVVRDNNRNELGKIVFEVKNAEWSNSWIPKLSADAGKQNTKYGILVTNKFSDKHHLDVGFVKDDEYENIWITDPVSFVFVAQIIRKLIEVEYSFNKQKQELTTGSHEETLKKYAQTIDALNNYMVTELPTFIKHFKTQMKTLTTVESSLKSNADKIAKVQDNLTKTFNKKIKERLEKISKQKVLGIEDEDSLSLDLDLETSDFGNNSAEL